jgi:dephospho-CoA kinase
MKIVGLTGSIGMGKSTVAAMLGDLGVPVFDADAEVHRLQGPGGALVDAIEAAFPGTTGPAGVDRQKLGARVLGDDAAMKRLEGIVHPAVGEARRRFLVDHAGESLVVFDIPLLFEKGGEASLSAVWVVSAPLDVQRARVLARHGMSAEKFESIVARQMPDDEKRHRATAIIDTGQSLDETRAQVAALVACIRASEGQ